MPEIFINYRTGDGETVAAHLRDRLVERFGADSVFHASHSIGLGSAYPDKLESALRKCSVLLALVGPDWINFRTKLSDPADWVRHEIVSALEWGTPVIPVLLGRHMPRLAPEDLPAGLTPLADLQSAVFDTHDVEGGVRRIGDAVAALVPGLEKQRDRPTPERGTVTNTTGDVGGSAVQARDVSGGLNFGTQIGDAHGPVHTGQGDIFQNPRFHRGDRHVSGEGAMYVEGDQHGGVRQNFGDRQRGEGER
ncbi:toll/interleukin-1 receptor domain-containing protein [Streptomyces sp. NRRL F-5630]|uniref:toll/interleukin-1 receptor domain-containing protein n=1 Tax=Streptomyces sp. NRRL F-5630 TaxID=1463864 RepID=UPI003D727924